MVALIVSGALLLAALWLLFALWYWWAARSLAADTIAHDHHEADAGTDNSKRGNS